MTPHNPPGSTRMPVAETAKTGFEVDYLLDEAEWSEDIARSLARSEGLDLTEAHLDVIRAAREYYRDHGPSDPARNMLNFLDLRFDQQGGRKYLYRLFPNGPVVQASKFAGLPLPPHSTDPAFGSVM